MATRGAALVALLSATVTACGVPRPGISNGSVSACFRAIPTARAAIHESSAHMVGLHRLPLDVVESHLRTGTTVAEDDTTVCAAVFKGSFAAGQVAQAPPDEHGKYAVVVVTSKHLRLLGAFVVDTLPKNLGRRLL